MTLPVAEPDAAGVPDAAADPDAAGVPERPAVPDAPGDPEPEAGGVDGGKGMYVQPGWALAAQATTMVARAATAMTLATRAKFSGRRGVHAPILAEIGRQRRAAAVR